MTTLLALDPGKVTGFAVFEPGRAAEWLLTEFGCIDAKDNDVEQIVVTHYWWLDGFIASHRLHGVDIAFEDAIYSHGLPSNSESHEVRGVIRCLAATHSAVRFWEAIKPSAAKKLLTGNGNAHKRVVGQAVKEILGVKRLKGGDHVPDAISVGMTFLHRIYGVAPQSVRLIEELAPA